MSSRRQLLVGAGVAASAILQGGGDAAAAGPSPTVPAAASRGEFLIRGGYVLSVDPAVGDIPGGDVHVKDGTIVAVGRRLAAPHAEVLDASDSIVMPGFVEVHWHMWNSLWRGMAHDAAEYFALHKLAPFYTAQDHYTAIRYAAAEAINAGLTTCHDWAHGLSDRADAEAEMRALLDAGIRARFGYGDTLNGGSTSLGLADLEAALKWLQANGDHGRVTLGLVVHNAKALPEEVASARKLGLKTIGPHADTSAHPELLGPDFIFTHGAGLPPAAFAAVAAARMKVGLCPMTDPLVGGGWPPLQEMLDAGVRFEDIGFSVDVNCQTAVDPFASMRMLMFSARIAESRAAGVKGFTDVTGNGRPAQLMMPRKLIELATINGARVLGIDDVTGSLTLGKRADVILVRTDRANMLPAPDTNPTFQLVQHGQPADVDTVIVDGRILKRGGKLVGVDPTALSKTAAQAQTAIRARAKLPPIDTTR